MSIVTQIYDAEFKEEGGEAKSATIRYDLDLGIPFTTVQAALDAAMADVNLPVPGTSWSTTYPLLTLVNRTPKIVAISPSVAVSVECEYELLRYNDAISEGGSTSLEEIETQIDFHGSDVWVTYNDQKQYPKIKVPYFKSAFTEEVVYSSDDPIAEAEAMTNAINATMFRNNRPGTVLCSHMEWEPVLRNASPPWYRFRADFEVKQGGWTYDATFEKADGTAAPPNDADANKHIVWHRSEEFNRIFAQG